MNTFKKTERELLKKYLRINKQLQKEIRSRNLIILNFANTGYVRASKEVKLIICKTFFCSKFMWYLEFRFSSDSDLEFRLPFKFEACLPFANEKDVAHITWYPSIHIRQYTALNQHDFYRPQLNESLCNIHIIFKQKA